MCDPTDSFTGTAALCTDGATASGWACTGHAHVDGEHLRCIDASHVVDPPEFTSCGVAVAPSIVVPPPGLSLYDAVRRSHQVETLAVR